MQPQLGIWKRFTRSLLGVDRCSLSLGSGGGLLEVYWGWTDAASAGHLEEVYRLVGVGAEAVVAKHSCRGMTSRLTSSSELLS